MLDKVSEVDSYTEIDLKPDGSVVVSLLDQVPDEARSPLVRLTDHVGAIPANLTPMMSSWYATNIAGPRSQALDRVNSILSANDEGSRTRGVFLEREAGKEEDQRLERKRQAQKGSQETRASDYERYSEARATYQKAKDNYDELHARHGREANLTPMWYVPGLLALGVAEMLINFESFNSVRNFTPAIALGATLVVAFLLAGSSHLHGTFLRQIESRFGAHRRDGDRAAAWRMFSLGTLGLTVTLAMVWYARNSLLAELLIEREVMGGQAPNWFVVIGGSLLGNLGVWIVGVILAFFAHDEDHTFPKALIDKNRAEKRMYACKERFNQPLKKEFQKIDATCEKNLGELQNKHNRLGSNQDFLEGRKLFAKIKEQDARVIAALELYRVRLNNATRNASIKFEMQPEIDFTEIKQLSADAYAALSLKIKYL